jgi:hypothetical protein
MALNSTAMLANDLAYMVNDLPATLLIGGKTIIGTAGAISKSKRVQMEGISADYDAEFTVAKSVLAVVAANTTCALNGTPMRVSRVMESPCGICWTLYLERQG